MAMMRVSPLPVVVASRCKLLTPVTMMMMKRVRVVNAPMKMTVTLILLPLLALITFTAPVVRAQGGGTTFQQVQKVFASDNEYGDAFGRVLEVSQDGLTMVVGAPYEDTGGSSAGAAYVYTRAVPSGNWTEVTKLQASDKQAEDHFGISVSTSADGSTVVVGAPFEDTV